MRISNLTESEGLSVPGAINSALRLNDAEKHMNEVHNTDITSSHGIGKLERWREGPKKLWLA